MRAYLRETTTAFITGMAVMLMVALSVFGSPPARAAHIPPNGPEVPAIFTPGNQTCGTLTPGSVEFKVDNPADGTFTSGTTTVTIDVRQTSAGTVFDWTSFSGGTVQSIFVKGGPDGNLYDYAGNGVVVSHDDGLHSPLNDNNGRWYGLSHISFCYIPGAPHIDVTKVCVNPAFLPGPPEQIRYTIEGKVTNDGDGALQNVALSDNPATEGVFQAFACDANGRPTGATTGDFPLASLAEGASVCYRATFLSATSGPSDTVTVTADSAQFATSVQDTAGTTCPQLVLEGRLQVTKDCAVVLEETGDQIVVRVNWEGTVTNPADSDFALTNVTVLNNQPAANTVVANYPTLAIGESQNFSGFYYPSAIGGPSPGNPLCAQFSDTLSASGTGPAIIGSPTITAVPDEALCKLCPPGQVCPI